MRATLQPVLENCMECSLHYTFQQLLEAVYHYAHVLLSCVPLATKPSISLIMCVCVATIRHTTDTFLFISHTTNVLLFKFLCNIFIGVRITKEMPGSVASGTPYIIFSLAVP